MQKDTDEMKSHIETLIEKAATRVGYADEAMKLTQAALNAANAISILEHLKRQAAE